MKVTKRVATSTGYTKEVFDGNTVENVKPVKLDSSSLISIDGSTSNSGLHVFNAERSSEYYGASNMSFSFERSHNETPVEYKVRLKRMLCKLFYDNIRENITVYEEPFLGYTSAVENLMMLRTIIDEIVVENDLQDKVYVIHTPNKSWKKVYLAPNHVPVGTDLEKKAIKEKTLEINKFTNGFSEDEFDAFGLGYAALIKYKESSLMELAKKVKQPPFKYLAFFDGYNIGDNLVDLVNDMINDNKISISDSVIDNGCCMYTMNRYEKFEQTLYNRMGGDDQLVILLMKPKEHGNIILKYKLSHLTNEDYICALCFRKNRKR